MRWMLLLTIPLVASCDQGFTDFQIDEESVRVTVDPTAPQALAIIEVAGEFSLPEDGDGGILEAGGSLVWGPQRESFTQLFLRIAEPDPAEIEDGGTTRVTVVNAGTTNEALIPLCGIEVELTITVSVAESDSSVGYIASPPVFILDCV